MQFAYEDRIAELRAQVDRITSRQLLDQEQFEQKLEQILRRQATLESRASTLTGVPDPTPTGSIGRNASAAPIAEPAASGPLKPSPISDTVIFTAPPDREARLESRALPASATRFASARARPARRRHRRRARAPAGLARPGRGAADRDAQHAGGKLRHQAPSACAACSPISASSPARRRRAAGRRRSVRAGHAAGRTPAPSSASSTASRSRAPRSTG